MRDFAELFKKAQLFTVIIVPLFSRVFKCFIHRNTENNCNFSCSFLIKEKYPFLRRIRSHIDSSRPHNFSVDSTARPIHKVLASPTHKVPHAECPSSAFPKQTAPRPIPGEYTVNPTILLLNLLFSSLTVDYGKTCECTVEYAESWGTVAYQSVFPYIFQFNPTARVRLREKCTRFFDYLLQNCNGNIKILLMFTNFTE